MQIAGLDLGSIILIILGIGALCLVGVVLFFGFQVIGSVLGSIVGLFQLVEGVITGGPIAWCGCLVVIFACIACVGGVWAYTACQANPAAMNFCMLFPR
jgi:hypothetical protein